MAHNADGTYSGQQGHLMEHQEMDPLHVAIFHDGPDGLSNATSPSPTAYSGSGNAPQWLCCCRL